MGAVLTPDVGSPILPTDPVLFDLTDASETLTSVLIAVRHDTGVIELAHDGTSFTSFYASGSSRTVITNGFHYSLVRAGGWADTKVVVSAFPFAGTGVGLINFSSDFGVLDDPPGEDVALSVTGATAGPFGNASHVATFTVDSKGRLTASGQTAIILTDNSSSPIAHVGSGGATATSAANIGDVNTAVAAEATLRIAGDATSATNLATETAARIAGDATSATNLATETAARIAGDATSATNLATETAARIAGDAAVTALIPGLSSATPAAVDAGAGAAGTGTSTSRNDHKHNVAVGSPVATGTANADGTGTALARADHVHQTSFAGVAAALAAATADVSVNAHKITSLASGGTTPTNAANIGDITANAALSVANETALAALDATNLPTGTRVWAATYRCFWTLDKATTRTAISNQVRAATGGAGWWWVRELGQGDPFWQNQAAWWIDPAGTAGVPGNDEADGLTSTTSIKSLAEWRRRVRGAAYGGANPSTVVINALSGSTVLDDGQINGVTTVGIATVVIMGTPTIVGSGTLTGAVAYSGNNRGTVTNSALPTSWASSYGLSSTSGSRYIRRVGGAGPAQAPLLQEGVAKTATIGLTTDTSETSTSTPTVNSATFSNGDSYQVVSRAVWPPLLAVGCRARLQCLDVSGRHFTTNFEWFDQYVLCGYLNDAIAQAGQINYYNNVFVGSAFVPQPGGTTAIFSCAFVGTTVEWIDGADLAFAENVLVGGARLNNHHAGVMRGVGILRCFDNTTSVLEAARGAHINIELGGGVVGSGNTGKLVIVFGGGKVTGASLITATTSDALPYQVAGASFSAPVVDGGSGDGIYN